MEAKNVETKTQKKVSSTPVARLAKRASEAAHETIDEVQERATRAEQRLVRRAEASGQSIVSRAGGVVHRVTNYVEENPFAAVTLAFGVGILLTVMLRASGVNLERLLTPPEDDLID